MRPPVERLVDLLHEHLGKRSDPERQGTTYFGQIEKAIQTCELEGVEAWLLADFFKTSISRTSMDEFCGAAHAGVSVNARRFLGRGVRQACDGSPWRVDPAGARGRCPMLATAILIGLTSRGPDLVPAETQRPQWGAFCHAEVSDHGDRRRNSAATNSRRSMRWRGLFSRCPTIRV